jgi:hypothetical protein
MTQQSYVTSPYQLGDHILVSQPRDFQKALESLPKNMKESIQQYDGTD